MNDPKEYTLPSGQKVKVRKLGGAGRARVLGSLPVIALDDSGAVDKSKISPSDAAKYLDYQVRLVVACCVDPKLTENPDGEQGKRFVDEVLDQEDFDALVKIIDDLSPKAENVRPLSETATT